MPQSSGLLVIDLQYGFSPMPDLVERIRDAAQDYSVVVATQFVNPPDSLFTRVLNDGKDGGAILDVGHEIVLEKTGYGLDRQPSTLCGNFQRLPNGDWSVAGPEPALWPAGSPCGTRGFLFM